MCLCGALFFLLPQACFSQSQSPSFTYKDTGFVVGATMVRRNVSFLDACQTKLNPKSAYALDSLVKLMKKFPNLKVEVIVHDGKPCKTCTACVPSQNGADAMKNYLVQKQIAATRLKSSGRGNTEPLTDNKKLAWKMNYRVEYKIIYYKY